MLKKLKNNITHPKHAFLYIKDKFLNVFLYIILLTFFMSLPIILLGTLNPRELVPNSKDLNGKYQYLYDENVEITNSTLNMNEKNHLIELGVFNISFGDVYYETPGFYLRFKENEIETYYNMGSGVTFQNKTYKYKDFEMEDYVFEPANSRKLTNTINDIFSSDNVLISGLIISSIFINLMDLLFIILLLSLLAHLTKRLPFKFKEHFKANTYIATIYAVTILILSLFNIAAVEFIPIIIVYIYQIIAYRSVKIIKQIQVRKKDE